MMVRAAAILRYPAHTLLPSQFQRLSRTGRSSSNRPNRWLLDSGQTGWWPNRQNL